MALFHCACCASNCGPPTAGWWRCLMIVAVCTMTAGRALAEIRCQNPSIAHDLDTFRPAVVVGDQGARAYFGRVPPSGVAAFAWG